MVLECSAISKQGKAITNASTFLRKYIGRVRKPLLPIAMFQKHVLTSVACLAIGFALGVTLTSSPQNSEGKRANGIQKRHIPRNVPASFSLVGESERIRAHRQDLESAINELFELRDHQDKTFALLGLLSDLPISDYATVLAAFENQSLKDAGRGRDQWIIAQALQIMAERDPTGVMAFASEHPHYYQRLAYMEASLRGWCKQDPTSARRWFDEIQDVRTKDRLSTSMAQALARHSFDNAMEFIGQHLKPNRAREAKAQILSELALVQPLEAAKHLETLELSQQFTHLYHSIATGLAAEDLDQALAWIQGLRE